MDEGWEAYKPEIERLYMEERKSQAHVMKIMRLKYGFSASKWQYENQFKKWRFKKNHGGKVVWIYIREMMKKRKIEGKPDGIFAINGVIQSAGNILTGIRRNAYEPTVERHKSSIIWLLFQLGGLLLIFIAPLPPTPEEVTVWSPISDSNGELKSPSNLPWLTFLQQIESRKMVGECVNIEKSARTRIKNILYCLSSSATFSLRQDFLFKGSTPAVAEMLRIIMPEGHEGEHLDTAKSLIHGDLDSHVLSLAFYMLSNSICLNMGQILVDSSVDESRISRIIRYILGLAKLDNIQSMKNLISVDGLTAEVISRKIFQSSIMIYDFEMVQIMLLAGMHPDTPMVFDKSHETPLQYLSETKECFLSIQLVHLLLSHGASLDPRNDSKPAITKAMERRNKRIFKLLLLHLHETHSSHNFSIKTRYKGCNLEDFVEMFVDVAVNPNCMTEEATLFFGRAKAGLVNWFIRGGLDLEAPQKYPVTDENGERFEQTTSLLGSAAAAGNMACMRVLIETGANLNLPTGLKGAISPLALAAHSKQLGSVMLLLRAGANVKAADQCKMLHEPVGKTLVQRAAPRSDLVLALLDAGAYASPEERQSMLSSAMFEAVLKNDVERASWLIALKGPVNPYCPQFSPPHALAWAVQSENTNMLVLLKASGASIFNIPVLRFGSIRTADSLKYSGWLFEILSFSGPRILASAILRCNRPLISFLLENKADQGNSSIVELHCNSYETKASPLGAAIYTHSWRLAQFLIQRGSLINDSDMNVIVSRLLQGYDVGGLSNLLRMIPNPGIAIPTAFGIAIMHNGTFLIESLLRFGFNPRGKPQVIFDLRKVRAKPPPKKDWHSEDFSSRLWWSDNSEAPHPFDSEETLKLDSVLQVAAQKGNRTIMEILLKLDIWTPEEKGKALIMSIQFNERDLVRDLLASGADANQMIDGSQYRPIRIQYPSLKDPLARCQAPECLLLECSRFRCQFLKCSSCSLQQPEIPMLNALVIAMDKGRRDVTFEIIRGGCNVNADLRFGYTALYFSTFCGKWFARTLLSYYAMDQLPSSEGLFQAKSALKNVFQNGDEEALEAFIDPTILHFTALLYSGGCRESTILQVIRAGDVKAMDLLLLSGLIGIKTRDMFMINRLIQAGADLNTTPDLYEGKTALQLAVEQEKITLINLLIEKGADINAPPAVNFGKTALQIAAGQGNIELVDLLLAKGADVNQEPAYRSGGTALQFAAIRGFIGIARALIEAGAAVDALGSTLFGRTAIEGAAEWGRIDTLQLLLSQGAAPEGPNRRQYIRAIKLAGKKGHFPIVKFLKERILWWDADALSHATEVFDDEEEDEMESESEVEEDNET
ncbi:hypothetical protein N7481_006590 [Penicillium waksmanii]|uniref:uncharacterized protein n=1 Tax=Penicillium waksmanii TaxID=69791 RepID=UPI002548F58A|nr:uncharacterized protein N7481_006590 [Penicillium waksmanii]KAJ5984491.1 hypothetical protein N7481_006590 [Penicillium waksmanii]